MVTIEVTYKDGHIEVLSTTIEKGVTVVTAIMQAGTADKITVTY